MITRAHSDLAEFLVAVALVGGIVAILAGIL